MSHWHRPPKVISVRGLIQRCAKCVVIDRDVEASCSSVKALSAEVMKVEEMDPAGKLSLADIVRLCQEMRAVLITSNSEVLAALMAESKAPWGAILFPVGCEQQADGLRRLTANQLNVRSGGDLDFMIASCQQNRMIVDMRQSRPTIGVYFSASRCHASN